MSLWNLFRNFCGILYFYKFLWTYQDLIEKEKNPTSGNIAREFLGRGYITVKLGDYEKTVYAEYSDYNINNNSRSLAYISYKYKADNYNIDGIPSDCKNLVDGWATFYESTV